MSTENKINLALLTSDPDTSDFLYANSVFGESPSMVTLHNDFKESELTICLEEYEPVMVRSLTNIVMNEDGDMCSTRELYSIGADILMSVTIMEDETSVEEDDVIASNLVFFYKPAGVDILDNILSSLQPLEAGVADESGVIYNNMLSIEDGSLVLDKYHHQAEDFKKIKYYYNTETLEEANDVINILNTEKKGIVYVSGEKGVGKTTLLNYIENRVEKNIIHVPVQLFEVFDSMEIHKFLKTYTDSIFILDDFDIEEYQSKKLINSIVHLVDGFKSNIYNTTFIICTNNDFDLGLINSNNDLYTLEVSELTDEKARALRAHLKIKSIGSDLRLVSVLRGDDTPGISTIGY